MSDLYTLKQTVSMKPVHTVLLIDDDADDCSFFQEALAGFSPHIAFRCMAHTDHLFEVIAITNPFLIVVDFKLAGENGVDCLRKLKAHPLWMHIPVVMWSTSGIPCNVRAAYEAGAMDFLIKPWNIHALRCELRKMVRQHLPEGVVREPQYV
jgi:DNA-binding NtrC family response regulator